VRRYSGGVSGSAARTDSSEHRARSDQRSPANFLIMVTPDNVSGTTTSVAATSRQFIRLGLTGGIASGKTTVLDMLRSRGAFTIDTDEIAHAILAKGSDVWKSVVEMFGRDILNPDETINRARLGEIVFADAARRQTLNELTHPAIRREWLGQIESLRGRGFAGVVAVAVPLLFETNAQSEFDVTVAVACSEATQMARLKVRGLSEEQARQRIAAQMRIQEKMTLADIVIWNDVPLAVLSQQVRAVWEKIGAMTK
jgi:dephospho-CoA kinase